MQKQINELNVPKTDEEILKTIHQEMLFNIEQLKKAQEELTKEMKLRGLL